LNGECIRRR